MNQLFSFIKQFAKSPSVKMNDNNESDDTSLISSDEDSCSDLIEAIKFEQEKLEEQNIEFTSLEIESKQLEEEYKNVTSKLTKIETYLETNIILLQNLIDENRDVLYKIRNIDVNVAISIPAVKNVKEKQRNTGVNSYDVDAIRDIQAQIKSNRLQEKQKIEKEFKNEITLEKIIEESSQLLIDADEIDERSKSDCFITKRRPKPHSSASKSKGEFSSSNSMISARLSVLVTPLSQSVLDAHQLPATETRFDPNVMSTPTATKLETMIGLDLIPTPRKQILETARGRKGRLKKSSITFDASSDNQDHHSDGGNGRKLRTKRAMSLKEPSIGKKMRRNE